MNFTLYTGCFLLMLVAAMGNPISGQDIDSSNTANPLSRDSSSFADQHKITYTLGPSLKYNTMRLSLSKAKYLDDYFYLDLFESSQQFDSESTLSSLKQLSQRKLQADLHYSFDWLQKDQQKRSLGWIGQALGYINAAAAAGLAAYHLYKYEIKKKKKE